MSVILMCSILFNHTSRIQLANMRHEVTCAIRSTGMLKHDNITKVAASQNVTC